jgi:hypothetical protein
LDGNDTAVVSPTLSEVDPVTTPFERALHLLLFVAAAAAAGVAGIGALERLSDGARRTVRVAHIALAATVFAMFFVAERIYHMVH